MAAWPGAALLETIAAAWQNGTCACWTVDFAVDVAGSHARCGRSTIIDAIAQHRSGWPGWR